MNPQLFQLICFYGFGFITVVAALSVITLKNTVHAVLSLVLTFFSTACLWMLADAEFLALALIVVYVGAVMVLFLFVVMMLDIDLFKCIFCGFCEESCPVDSIVETSIHEYHFEHRGENVVNKLQLLAIGDRFEKQIAADRTQDAAYR